MVVIFLIPALGQISEFTAKKGQHGTEKVPGCYTEKPCVGKTKRPNEMIEVNRVEQK